MKFLDAQHEASCDYTHVRDEPGGELPNYMSLIWINIARDREIVEEKNDADVTGWQIEGGVRRCKRLHINKKKSMYARVTRDTSDI